MPLKYRIVLALPIALALLTVNCKKSSPARSSAKGISSFVIQASLNAYMTNDIVGQITGDSIYLPDPPGVSLVYRTPTIAYTGAGINPSPSTRQDFSRPVNYTITAADGSTVSYVVMPRLLSGSKVITSFGFKAVDNPGLDSNLTATIVNDSIFVHADSSANLSSLIPAITYTGVSLSPVAGTPKDFSKPVTYTVTAQDSTSTTYVVIVSHDSYLYVGSDDGNLYAIDAASGDLVWKYKTGGPVTSSPTLDNGMLYFLSGDSYVYALHSADGSLAWKYQATPDGQPTTYGSNPTVHSGVVYLNTSAYLIALDASSGALKWQNYVDFYSTDNSPTLAGSLLYDPTFNGGGPVVASDPSTGSLVRDFPGGIGRGNPAVVNGVVYATNGNHILDAWDAQSGALKFSFFISAGTGTYAGPGNSPTLYNGIVFIGGPAGLFALDANTGSVLWQQNTTPGVGSSSPVAAEGLVFSYTDNGYLIAFNVSEGVINWSFAGDYDITLNLTYANGTLYTGAVDGSIVARTAATGQTKWKYSAAGPVHSGACILDASGVVHHTTASGDQQ